eukprot:TRINITY_DN37446_c0_g1_i1.p1 TRINITY_DN37446_c0_g1~~TRINITY_DN37446_c0_g1_i1.p1  ORF type:complete len:498 (+),score=104.60 TRINITY_DN37446_c0_g1_i1:46-1539(+)
MFSLSSAAQSPSQSERQVGLCGLSGMATGQAGGGLEVEAHSGSAFGSPLPSGLSGEVPGSVNSLPPPSGFLAGTGPAGDLLQLRQRLSISASGLQSEAGGRELLQDPTSATSSQRDFRAYSAEPSRDSPQGQNRGRSLTAGTTTSALSNAGPQALAGASASAASAGNPALGDVDLTVMAYAQWLSDVKQQAASARYHQQAELDVMRDAIGAHSGELTEFKRHSTMVVQQLQSQVAELRVKVSDIFAELKSHSRQRAESELHARSKAESDAFTSVSLGLREDPGSPLASGGGARAEVGKFHTALTESQEQTLLKFGEVDHAMTVLHSNCTNLQKEMQSTKGDWKKGQDLLSQAISTLSQDFSDFQKHSTTVLNKAQSDVYHLQEMSRNEQERLNRAEVQLSALHQNVHAHNNEIILLSQERKEAGIPRGHGHMQQVPQAPSTDKAAAGADVHPNQMLQELDNLHRAREQMQPLSKQGLSAGQQLSSYPAITRAGHTRA